MMVAGDGLYSSMYSAPSLSLSYITSLSKIIPFTSAGRSGFPLSSVGSGGIAVMFPFDVQMWWKEMPWLRVGVYTQ